MPKQDSMETTAVSAPSAMPTADEDLKFLLYAITHDLMEPLRMVRCFLELLEREHGESLVEEGQEFLSVALNGANRMQEMIEALQLYSRLDKHLKKMEPAELSELWDYAAEACTLQIKDSEAQVTCDPLPRLLCSPFLLERLFQNLLSNALRYRSPERRPEVHFSARQTEEAWEFRCTDNGIGIKEAHRERIFRLFQRLHTQDDIPGTGMGLSICKKIVELHRGEIWVEPRPTPGVTFAFSLPLPTPEL